MGATRLCEMSVSASDDRTFAAGQVIAFRAGDDAAREWLALRACQVALRTAAAILRSGERAREVAQDVAVEVLKSLSRLRDPEAFDAWVHRITVRHALRAAASQRGRERAEMLLPEHGGDGYGRAGVVGLATDDDFVLAARTALSGALARLPARQRAALALRYIHDLSDAEIADALGCQIGTVHALLSRGRKALRADTHLMQLTETNAEDG